MKNTVEAGRAKGTPLRSGGRRSHTQLPRRRAAISTFGAAALAFAAVAAISTSAAASNINTYKKWDGTEGVGFYGCPDTTTYGQVITIPEDVTTLDKVTFSWKRIDQDGELKVRAEVYAWDGSKASGSAVFESKKRTISYPDFDFHTETFKTHGVAVAPGAQYVVFASIDKDYSDCTNNYKLGWGSVADRRYSGGSHVSLNTAGDESLWTAAAWDVHDADLVFKVYFTP